MLCQLHLLGSQKISPKCDKAIAACQPVKSVNAEVVCGLTPSLLESQSNQSWILRC